MPLSGSAGARTAGPVSDVVTGLPKASNHNGGRIKFGPDGMLYVTAGDASDGANAQTLASLGGKILRVTVDGQVPGDNPFPASPVWSLGHRNPQGIAWAADGTLWAAEFGQNTWDEINRVTPGANYGWPLAEGTAGAPGLVDPVQQWSTDDTSPSGIAVVGDTVFMAGLGGERLWSIRFDGSAVSHYDGQLGRIRDVVRGPGTSLYLLTNNTDGRGTPRDGDDVLYRVELVAAG
jgi:glucose/arabinose dehydrogenase